MAEPKYQLFAVISKYLHDKLAQSSNDEENSKRKIFHVQWLSRKRSAISFHCRNQAFDQFILNEHFLHMRALEYHVKYDFQAFQNFY